MVSVLVDFRHRFRDLPTVTQLMGVKLELRLKDLARSLETDSVGQATATLMVCLQGDLILTQSFPCTYCFGNMTNEVVCFSCFRYSQVCMFNIQEVPQGPGP